MPDVEHWNGRKIYATPAAFDSRILVLRAIILLLTAGSQIARMAIAAPAPGPGLLGTGEIDGGSVLIHPNVLISIVKFIF